MRSAPSSLPTLYQLFGVEVLSCSLDQACDLIESRIFLRTPTRIAFLNANLSLLTIERAELRHALGDFIVFNDGVGVSIANRVLNGSSFDANLNGTDLIPCLLTRIRKPLRLFLLGTTPETLDKVISFVRERWPHRTVVGQSSGYYKPEHEPALLQSIIESRPSVVLVAMGNPTQELWIARHIPGCAPCAIGVGGLFDFVAGNVQRAPGWIRAARLEWVFRLALEPRRLWRRYLIGNARFLAHVLAVRLSWLSSPPEARPSTRCSIAPKTHGREPVSHDTRAARGQRDQMEQRPMAPATERS
jgi:exopolysaccharide biosynthesis WecB/TagA/CpsF family protein